jgi:uncharacterized membrane protein
METHIEYPSLVCTQEEEEAMPLTLTRVPCNQQNIIITSQATPRPPTFRDVLDKAFCNIPCKTVWYVALSIILIILVFGPSIALAYMLRESLCSIVFDVATILSIYTLTDKQCTGIWYNTISNTIFYTLIGVICLACWIFLAIVLLIPIVLVIYTCMLCVAVIAVAIFDFCKTTRDYLRHTFNLYQ